MEAVLSHYTDDFEMSSPFITRLTGEPSGTLRGRQAVGEYWRTALQRIPDLHFRVTDVFVGREAFRSSMTPGPAGGRPKCCS